MSGLVDQVITIDFSGGIDQRTDERYVQPGKLTGLVNGAFDKIGTIHKRLGFAPIPQSILPSGSLTSAAWLQSYRGELLTSDGDFLYSLAPSNAGWVKKDKVPEPVAVRTPVASLSPSISSFSVGTQQAAVYDPDCAVSASGFAVHVWIQANAGGFELRSTVSDVASGTVILASALVDSAAAFSPRLVVVGAKVVCMWPDAAGKIYIAQLDVTSAATVAAGWNYFGVGSSSVPVVLINDAIVAARPQFDVVAAGSSFFVFYNSNAPANPIHVKKYPTPGAGLPAPSASRSSTDLAGVATQLTMGCTVNTSVTRVLLVYGNVSGGFLDVRATDFDVGLTGEGTPRSLFTTADTTNAQCIGVVSTSSTGARACVTGTGSPLTTYFKTYDTATGPAAGVPGTMFRTVVASKPVLVGALVYVLLYTQVFEAILGLGIQSSLVLAEVGNSTTRPTVPRPVCLLAPALATFPLAALAPGAPTAPCGMSFLVLAQKWITSGCTLRGAGGARGIDQIAFDFAPPRGGGVETMGAFLLTGGMPCAYDSATVTEAGFLHYPEQIVVAHSHTGTGSIANGTYQYACCFAYTNARGEVMRSAPSPQKQVTTAGTDDTVTLTIDTLQVSKAQDLLVGVPNQQRPVVIEVYRSTAGGNTLQLVGTIANDVTNPTVTFVDKLNDSAILGNQFLYTTGGTIPNTCPPCSTIACIHKGRVFMSGCDDSRQVWFSRLMVAGEPPAFNFSNVLVFGEGGAVTGLASMDDVLIVFKKDRIFALSGQGPNDAGLQNDYGVPMRVSSDLGCIEPRSVVLTPQGLMFQSAVGIYLLSRQLEVTYLGAPVDDSITTFSQITSAVVHPYQTQVRFTACDGTDPGGNDGVILVYDYVQNQWGTYRVLDSVSGNTSVPMIGACNMGNLYCWIATNGSASRETPGAYADAGQWITLSVSTAWIQAAKMQGYQRVRRVGFLGEQNTQHDLTMTIETDFGASPTQTSFWRSDVIAALPLEQVLTHVANQKCQALRVTISDSAPTGPGAPAGGGQGPTLTGLALRIAAKRGTKTVGQLQRR